MATSEGNHETGVTESAHAPRRLPVFLPMLLSAFVCPGLGQLVQRRWRAGIVCLAASMAAILWCLAETLPVIRALYQLGFADIAETETAAATFDYSTTRIGMALGTFLLIWLVNIFDIFYAVTRERLCPPMFESTNGDDPETHGKTPPSRRQ